MIENMNLFFSSTSRASTIEPQGILIQRKREDYMGSIQKINPNAAQWGVIRDGKQLETNFFIGLVAKVLGNSTKHCYGDC